MNGRRRVLALYCVTGLAMPRSVFGQTTARRIGFLHSGERPASFDAGLVGVFRKGMRELGYVEGRSVQYEWRFSEGKYAPLEKFAAELAGLRIDLIVTVGTPATRAVQKATRSIPIVMIYTGDPVGSGFVASLARPGGNITGITNINVEMNEKRVQLLRTVVPGLTRIAALLNPSNPTYPSHKTTLQAAAQKAGLALVLLQATTPAEIDGAFASLKADALIVHTDSFFSAEKRRIGERIMAARVPAITPRANLDEGGLLSYEPSQLEAFRRAPAYVDRILKGAKPADLAVEQPDKLEVTLNMATAKALGIPFPPELMLIADEVLK